MTRCNHLLFYGLHKTVVLAFRCCTFYNSSFFAFVQYRKRGKFHKLNVCKHFAFVISAFYIEQAKNRIVYQTQKHAVSGAPLRLKSHEQLQGIPAVRFDFEQFWSLF